VGNTTESGALEELIVSAENLVNPALEKWKEEGGKVVGYFCSYLPDEILTAADILPFRIRGTGEEGTELADEYLHECNCSFAKGCLNAALGGRLELLDGVIWLNTCDHVRRLYEIWRHAKDTPPFLHFLGLPKKTEERQVRWFREELEIFKEALEKHFGIEISENSLWRAINLHNQRRRLQRKLYALRRSDAPPISGAETLAVMVAGTATPVEHYNQLLRNLLVDLQKRDGISDYRARVMVIGGVLDDPSYMDVIEDQGALVVTDMLCFGTKLMWADVDEGTDDPLTALARYQIKDRPLCPRFFGVHEKRAAFVREMIRDFNVDAVVGQRLLFCDGWQWEHVRLEEEYKKDNIPHLTMDREYRLGTVGQLRTRIQALLESIGR